MKINSVILVDGSYYLYSLYYALPSLMNTSGEPTWVIYGIVNMLKNVLLRYRPESIIVVFDAPGRTFRDKLFEGYKFFRKSMPKDLCLQISPIYRIIEAMGIPLLVIPEVEADDVIGTLSVFFSKILDRHVYIFSGDKDMMQLVTDNVHVVDSRLNKLFTKREVQKKYGISPYLMIDYLSLLGDVIDNIPGVPGVGKVSSKVLVQKLGCLNLIYRNLDKVLFLTELRARKSIFLKLEKYRFLAFLSCELVTIRTNVLLNGIYDNWYMKSVDFDTLAFFFRHYEFKRWLESLLSGKWLNGYYNKM